MYLSSRIMFRFAIQYIYLKDLILLVSHFDIATNSLMLLSV